LISAMPNGPVNPDLTAIKAALADDAAVATRATVRQNAPAVRTLFNALVETRRRC
jgi:hypothetical protein